MKIEIVKKQNNNSLYIRPEGDVTIYTVNELKTSLTEVLKNFSEIEIDLSEVKKIDTAGFQLFLALKKINGNNIKSIRIINTSEIINRLMELYREKL